MYKQVVFKNTIRIAVIFVITFNLACNSNKEYKDKQTQSENIKDKNNCRNVFTYSNDTIVQTIKIDFQSKSINFDYEIINTKNDKKKSLKGKAIEINDENGNMETIDDENDNAFSSSVYEFKSNKNWIRIYIDNKNKTLLKIIDFQEDDSLHLYTPINSTGILKRNK